MHKIIELDNGTIHIVGNNHFRDIVYGWEITEAERAEHDYLDYNDENKVHEFVRYRGWTYYLGDFMSTRNTFYGPHPDWMKPYDGYFSEGFIGGVLVSYGDADDMEFGEKVKVYRYY